MCTDGHTERRTHEQNDQSHNLLQCSLRSHLAEIIKMNIILQTVTEMELRHMALVRAERQNILQHQHHQHPPPPPVFYHQPNIFPSFQLNPVLSPSSSAHQPQPFAVARDRVGAVCPPAETSPSPVYRGAVAPDSPPALDERPSVSEDRLRGTELPDSKTRLFVVRVFQ